MAACGLGVEQFASYIGVGNCAGIFIFDLVQTAAPASVTQGFPLFAVELLERKIPEILSHRTHFSNSAAMASGPRSVGSVASGLPSGLNR